MSKDVERCWYVSSYTGGRYKVAYSPDDVVCEVHTVDSDGSEDIPGPRTLYRASLLAAAPEMLNALRRIVVECDSDHMKCTCAPPGNGEACPKCEIAYVAKNAIFKAVGGRG